MTKEEKDRDLKMREEIREDCKLRDEQFPNAMKKIITKKEMETRKKHGLDCTNYVTLQEALRPKHIKEIIPKVLEDISKK